ncbi:MAK10-like protein [Tanacetum coccineum]
MGTMWCPCDPTPSGWCKTEAHSTLVLKKDPNQHLKDFLKLVDSLDLDVANRERTRLHLFQFSLRDQASNWPERLPAGSISTWEDLTTRFLAQFFPPERTAKLQNDILMRTIDQSTGGKLRDKNVEESWALLEDLAFYDNESWNFLPRDFAKPVKEISLPHDVPSTFDRRLIELEIQVQRLMEAHLAPKSSVQVNKVASSCEIRCGPHDTQYCMENPEQAFVDYASSRTDEVGGKQKLHGSRESVSIDHLKEGAPRSKRIKSPSKLLSPKYLSQSSLEEQNRNPSSPKCVHFINSIVILRKEDEPEEEETMEPNAAKDNDHNATVNTEEEVIDVTPPNGA